MGTAGMAILRSSGKRGLRTTGMGSVLDHLGECPPCCAHCETAIIAGFTGYGPVSHHNLVPFQGPGIAPTGQTDSRWGLFVLPPYGGFHNLTLSTAPSPGANGYLRTDCADCYPPTHWIDTVYGFVADDGSLIGLPSVIDVSPNVLTIYLLIGCPNADETAVDFPFMGARPWF